MKVKASNRRCVPSQTNLLRAPLDLRLEMRRRRRRGSRLLMPSAATIRSASAKSREVVRPRVRTPAPRPARAARSCRMLSRRLRSMPQKPWPLRGDDAALEMDVDVVPVREAALIRAVWLASSPPRRLLERLVGEHHAPAERVVRPVALDHGDAVRGIAPSSSEWRSRAPPARRRCRRSA